MQLIHAKVFGDGQPLFIVHGYFGMSDNWKSLSQNYVKAGYQVHLLDMRNHGHSFHSEEFNYAVMVQDVLNYADSLSIASFDLIGHSMGGKMAMFLATQYPEKVSKLIVADIAPRYYPPHHQTILEAINAVDFSNQPSRSAVEEQLMAALGDAGLVQFLAKNLYWKTPGQLDFRFNREVLTRLNDNVGEGLPAEAHYNGPALFIRGGNSGYIKARDVEDIKRQFPQSIVVTLKDAGHWLHAEKPQEFVESTLAFLQHTSN